MGTRGPSGNRRHRRWLSVAVAVLLVAGLSVAAERAPAPAMIGYSGGALPRTAAPRPAPSAPSPTAPSPSTIVPAGSAPTAQPGAPEPDPARAAPQPPPTAPPAPPPATLVAPPSPLPDLATDQPRSTATPSTPPEQRTVYRTDHAPFATVGGVELRHPAMHVERIGLHQSNHEGARDLTVLPSAAAPVVLESRGRLSGAQSAADVVVDPADPIVSPVSGTVIRGGVYTLYCDLTDEFVVIAPDAQPSWEVKLLHVVGLRVVAGQHVEAGVTPIADRAHLLPFASQVDEQTADPSWPHTHIEVVDPAIPNQPNGGSGSEDCS